MEVKPVKSSHASPNDTHDQVSDGHHSIGVMLKNSIDRFGARLERRHTRAEMIALIRGAGLVDVVTSRAWPVWHGVGKKLVPAGRPG